MRNVFWGTPVCMTFWHTHIFATSYSPQHLVWHDKRRCAHLSLSAPDAREAKKNHTGGHTTSLSPLNTFIARIFSLIFHRLVMGRGRDGTEGCSIKRIGTKLVWRDGGKYRRDFEKLRDGVKWKWRHFGKWARRWERSGTVALARFPFFRMSKYRNILNLKPTFW